MTSPTSGGDNADKGYNRTDYQIDPLTGKIKKKKKYNYITTSDQQSREPPMASSFSDAALSRRMIRGDSY